MYKGSDITAVIVAGGKGLRFGGDLPKQFLKLGGETVLQRTVRAFSDSPIIDRIVCVIPSDYEDLSKNLLEGIPKVTDIVTGGEERGDSVMRGLERADTELVLIHDGARPFITEDVIERVAEETISSGACVPTVPPKDSIRTREANLDRDKLFLIQTPQGFRTGLIKEAYNKAKQAGFKGTDDGSIAEFAGFRVTMALGSYDNIKITTKEDLPGMEVRTGQGFDVHRLVEGRKCILMGVEIPYEKGLLGHSDADVALHALMDAMLGAAAMGDIGRLFPDNDPKYEGISSVTLLSEVRDRIYGEGYSVGNLDVTIICERPKVSPYIPEMTAKLASVLGIEEDRINIKGTTTEKLGFTGRGEGIASQAVCTLIR